MGNIVTVWSIVCITGGSDAVQKYWVEVTEADSKFSQFFNKVSL